MTNTVSIRYMITGNVFNVIKYNNFNELYDKLESIILNHDSEILIKLLINDKILNYHNAINTSLLPNLNEDTYISVIFSDKKKLYCLNNENGIYILDSYCDKYSKLLNIIIKFYENDSYDIIMNSSYKEIVLESIKQNEYALEYASIDLHNNKEFILESINAGCVLLYVNIVFRHNKEVMLEAVKKNGRSLYYTSIKLQDDKDIVLTAVKQNGRALIFASDRLKKNKVIALEAVKQSSRAFIHVNKRLRKNKDIILAYNQHNQHIQI